MAILTGLAGITTAAWIYVVLEAHRMTDMASWDDRPFDGGIDARDGGGATLDGG